MAIIDTNVRFHASPSMPPGDLEFVHKNPATELAFRLEKVERLELQWVTNSVHGSSMLKLKNPDHHFGRVEIEATNDIEGPWYLAIDARFIRTSIFWMADGSLTMASVVFRTWSAGRPNLDLEEISSPLPAKWLVASHRNFHTINDATDGFLEYAMREHPMNDGCSIFLDWLKQDPMNVEGDDD